MKKYLWFCLAPSALITLAVLLMTVPGWFKLLVGTLFVYLNAASLGIVNEEVKAAKRGEPDEEEGEV